MRVLRFITSNLFYINKIDSAIKGKLQTNISPESTNTIVQLPRILEYVEGKIFTVKYTVYMCYHVFDVNFMLVKAIA